MKDTIKYQEEQIRKYKCYVADLVWRHDKAINALARLAEGVGREYDNRPNGWQHAMQRFASDEVAQIAKLQLRRHE